ncbi:MAG TPA: sigma-70 family RNA polymerase sigma factor [Fimbriiglobus sp.]|nr:sigma-70 family RNA polymerase sigma factor [Fimbriiglobus sp.]
MPSTVIRGWRMLGRESTEGDGELLDRFTSAADGNAFAELLHRHGPWVLGLCRRLVSDPHAAEDAFQATFLVLVRRAGAVRNRASVASWLHGVAFKVAARARDRARPIADPADRPAPGPDPATLAARREEARILHEEVARLPTAYREAVLLCDLAGLSRDEAAARLDCPAGAVKGRLERGRAMLRDRLTRRGIVAAPSIAVVPVALANTTAQAAAGMLATGLASVPVPVAELVATASRPALLPALTTLVVLLAGVVSAGYGIGIPAPPVTHAISPRTFPTVAPVPAADNRPAKEALQQAAKVLDEVERESMARTRLWCVVAELYSKLGDPIAARDALDKARAAAAEMKADQYTEWRDIGQGYGRLGDVKTVTDLAAAVPAAAIRDGYPRDTILQESAWAAAAAGHARAADQIADALPDGDRKTWAKAAARRLAIAHRARTGDAAGAVRAAGELPTNAEKVHALVGVDVLNLSYDNSPARWEDGIAFALLEAGNRTGAKAAALKALALLPDVEKDRRGAAAAAVVRVLARLDDVPAVRKALAHVPAGPDPKLVKQWPDVTGWDLNAKAYLAAAEVRAGRDETAKALALDFKRPREQAHVLQFVALAQARKGRKDEAKTTFARAIELATAKPGSPGVTLNNIATAQALAGDFEGAAKTAEKTGVHAWVNLAYFRAKTGDYDGARNLVVRQRDKIGRWWHAKVWQFVAKTQAKAGKTDDVRAWIKEEGDSLLKAHALVGLAEGLFREDRPKATR